MFLLFRQLSGTRFLLYCLVQTAGAFFGAALASFLYIDALNEFDGGIRQVYGPKATAAIFASYPSTHLSAFGGLVDQVCDALNEFDGGIRQVYGPKATAAIFASYPSTHLSSFGGLVDQVYTHVTDDRNSYPKFLQPLLIGASFIMIGTAFGLNCGYPLNPARDFAHVTDDRNSYPKFLQPLLIGVSFIMIGTAFGLNCGYPLNPARDFGPRLFTLMAGYGGEVFRLVFLSSQWSG
ncbi:unnamed protein product [Gongylonema pulchrum]|uniref:Aquaporin-9 n=1 Tax=Gongylonema pulchrum TaxID=637853 RepID=A0A183EH74_9BILA|nr:unnamed protein product [Gongylonema pulchrum]